MLPLFYQEDLPEEDTLLKLPEDIARHLVQVLRKTPGYAFYLTDGKGRRAEMVLEETGKKTAVARGRATTAFPQPKPLLTLAVAFTKAAPRNEWLLEKAAELGVSRIVPLRTRRSENERFRPDRWGAILVAAMQQSQQYWLPDLAAPVLLSDFLQKSPAGQRFIAHCVDTERSSFAELLSRGEDAILLIGPEGDFTPEEIQEAVGAGFRPVTLGPNRLRTETAAMAGAAYFRLLNDA